MEEARIQRETYEKVLYTTVGKKCYKITSHGCEEVQDLQCQQEEADGRLPFHAVHAAREGYQDKIGAPLFQICGTKTRSKLVDIRKVAALSALISA